MLLHQGQRGSAYIIGTVQRAGLGDANGIVDTNPLRSEAAGVVGVGVFNILRLADEPLIAGEFENVEVLHVDGKKCFW